MTSHRDTGASEDAWLPVAHVTFAITGDGVSPDFWTGYFGISPDIAVAKGLPFVTPSGRTSSTPGRTGVWGITSKLAVRDDSLDSHLLYLLGCLRFPRRDLVTALRDAKASMRFLCYRFNRPGTRGAKIAPEIIATITSFGATVEIDEYPQENLGQSTDDL
jgi:hypothetical protein